MFIDNVELTLCSGNGGAGCVSFRREKFVIKGGPDGGDGGKGGDVIFITDRNSHTLSNFRGTKKRKAKNGQNGMDARKSGKKGANLNIIVPPGTQVIDKESGELIFDMVKDGEKKLFLRGGKGGLGNWHFKRATNQTPRYAQSGIKGECREVKLELKLIADVGLVGFPNVGKSTLVSTMSNAKPEIANYEFTTLTPSLGVVNVDDFTSFVMADIPGIIGGASGGKGLGIEFLKHIERTNFLLFMLDIGHYTTLLEQYTTLQKELKNFSKKLSNSKFAIALSRADIFDTDTINNKIDEFLKELSISKSTNNRYKFDEKLGYFYQEDEFSFDNTKPYFIAPISSATKININPLKYALNECISLS